MRIQFYPFKKLTWLSAAILCLYAQQSSAQLIYANSQTNGVTGLCLLCGVTSPNNPVNNSSLDDHSTFNITAGLGTVTVHQTLIFPSASSSNCDSLIIGIGAPTNPVVNPYGPVTVQTLNGNTANNDGQVVSDAILRQVQGYARAEIVLKPQQSFDRVKLTLNINGLGLLTSFKVYYAYRKPGLPSPQVTDTTAICAGATTLLTAVPEAGGGIRWYDAPTNGNVLFTGNSFAVTPAVTTTYYAAAFSGNCTSTRVPVTVTVKKLPAPVLDLPETAICGSQPLTVLNHQAGTNYHVRAVYTGAGTTPVLDTSYLITNSAQFTTPANPSPGDVQAAIYVQAFNADGSCRSDTTTGSFTAGGAGALPIVDAAEVTACAGTEVTLHAYTADPSIPFINWYDAPTGGNLLHTGDYFTVSPAVTTTYYVTSQAQCEFPQRKAVKVITRPRPPIPVLATPDTIYMPRFSGVTLTANGAPGSTIRWYRSDTTQTPLYTGNSYSFTALSAGTLFFFAGAELDGCESIRKQVTVIVYSGDRSAITQSSAAPADTAARMVMPVKGAPAIQALQVFPNPTSGEIRFMSAKDLSGSMAVIRDINGREVQREVLQRNGLHIGRLPANGIYFIQVITRQQEVFTSKVLLHK